MDSIQLEKSTLVFRQGPTRYKLNLGNALSAKLQVQGKTLPYMPLKDYFFFNFKDKVLYIRIERLRYGSEGIYRVKKLDLLWGLPSEKLIWFGRPQQVQIPDSNKPGFLQASFTSEQGFDLDRIHQHLMRNYDLIKNTPSEYKDLINFASVLDRDRFLVTPTTEVNADAVSVIGSFLSGIPQSIGQQLRAMQQRYNPAVGPTQYQHRNEYTDSSR